MFNKIETKTDGINVYNTIRVKSSRLAIWGLAMVLIIEFVVVVLLFSQVKPEELTSMLFPFIIVLIFFMGIPLKYLFWNIYGSEELIINTKSISWSYGYGFYKTSLKTVRYDKLGTGFEIIKEDNGIEFGKLIFYNYKQEDDIPELIHQTTILISKTEIDVVNNYISNIFENDFLNRNKFTPFSIN